MFSIIGKIFDWIFSFFGNIFSSFTLRDQNAFLQTKLAESQKELAPFKDKLAVCEEKLVISEATMAKLETKNAQLKTRIAEFEQQNEHSLNLAGDALQILRLLAENDSHLTIQELEMVLELPRIQVQHSVDNLVEHKFLQGYRTQTKAIRYSLSQTGRSFALKNSS